MPRNIILIEDRQSPLMGKLKRILRWLPEREKGDRKLQRLLAFRLMVDGESKTREYFIRNIKKIIQCSYKGSFYDFFKDDAIKMECDS